MNKEINNAGDALGHLVSSVLAAIPKALAAGLILLVGYLIAKALCKAVKAILTKAELDKRLHSGQGGNVLQKAVPSPTGLASKVVFWLVMLLAISSAVGALGVPILTGIIAGIFAYLPNVLAALLIFLVAGTVAGAVTGLVAKTMGDTPTGKIVGTVAPVVIMSIAGFMILDQLMIAPAIVIITYTALMGGAALGLALAFGLGGRDTAARIIANAYSKSEDAKRRATEDVKVGKRRAEKRVETGRQRFLP